MDMYSGYAELERLGGQDPATVQAQLLAHVPLVKRVVRQLASQAGGVMDREDMEQVGLMGLLEALRRYGDPDEQFGAYAATRVRGAILDELRRLDWRPRAVRQDAHKARDQLRALTRQLGREPSEAEAAAALGLSSEDYQAHLVAENAESMASFDELFHEMADSTPSNELLEERVVLRRSLEQALRVLDEREQRVIQLYYEFELSLKEIAAVLDLTEARVCQLNKGALKKMKALLEQD